MKRENNEKRGNKERRLHTGKEESRRMDEESRGIL